MAPCGWELNRGRRWGENRALYRLCFKRVLGDGPLCDPQFGCWWYFRHIPVSVTFGLNQGQMLILLMEVQVLTTRELHKTNWIALFCKDFGPITVFPPCLGHPKAYPPKREANWLPLFYGHFCFKIGGRVQLLAEIWITEWAVAGL